MKNEKRLRLAGGGRKLTNPQFDKDMGDWINGLRAQKFRVSRNIILIEAQKRVTLSILKGI